MLAAFVLRVLGIAPTLLLALLLLAAGVASLRSGLGAPLVLAFGALTLLSGLGPRWGQMWQLGRALVTFRHGDVSVDDEAVYTGGRRALARNEVVRVECFSLDGRAEVTLDVQKPGRRPYSLVLRAGRGEVRDFAEALGADLLQPPGLTASVGFSQAVPGERKAWLLRVRHAYGWLFVPTWIASMMLVGMLGAPVLAVGVAFGGVALLVAMVAASLRPGRVALSTDGIVLEGNGARLGAARPAVIPWTRVMSVDRAPTVLTVTLLGAGEDDTETLVMRPTLGTMHWRLAAAMQTHLAAARARRRGLGVVEALAQGGRSVAGWCASLERLTAEAHGYREGPGVSPEALWLVATDETADSTVRVAALVALAAGEHIAPDALLWSLARRDPAVGEVVPEGLAGRPFAREVAIGCLAAVAEPGGAPTGVRIAGEVAEREVGGEAGEGRAPRARARGIGGWEG